MLQEIRFAGAHEKAAKAVAAKLLAPTAWQLARAQGTEFPRLNRVASVIQRDGATIRTDAGQNVILEAFDRAHIPALVACFADSEP